MPKRRERSARTTALSGADIQMISSTIHRLRDRVVSHHTTDLTCEDILHTFINPEHRALARQCASVLGKSADVCFNVNREDYKLTCWLQHAGPGFVLPAYAGGPVFDSERFEKITSWANFRIEIGRQFSTLYEVFIYLNNVCKDAATMRFLWPGFVGLAAAAGLDVVDKVREAKMPKYIPALPMPLRAVLQEATTTIIKATMLPARQHKECEVRLSMDVASYRVHRMPWDARMVMTRM